MPPAGPRLRRIRWVRQPLEHPLRQTVALHPWQPAGQHPFWMDRQKRAGKKNRQALKSWGFSVGKVIGQNRQAARKRSRTGLRQAGWVWFQPDAVHRALRPSCRPLSFSRSAAALPWAKTAWPHNTCVACGQPAGPGGPLPRRPSWPAPS